MGLKEALRLKSFDSKELDIRATRTPKGYPPYLNLVKENLYQIREPEAPDNQGGSSGQGGSGSAPVIRTVDTVPAQAVVVVCSDKGKKTSSGGRRGLVPNLLSTTKGCMSLLKTKECMPKEAKRAMMVMMKNVLMPV
ncbi:hypothetical protein Hdeb2414_s0018g00525431 [Helianthus debilis subsp. tardiflorus]